MGFEVHILNQQLSIAADSRLSCIEFVIPVQVIGRRLSGRSRHRSTLGLTTVSNGLEALANGITLEEVYGPETIYNLGCEAGSKPCLRHLSTMEV